MIKTPRSTPLRLSLALLALFLVVSLATLAVAFFVARSSIETTIRDTLAQDLVGFQAAPSAFAVSQMVEARGRAMDPSERIIGYLDPLGRMHGNGAIVPTEAGFQAISLQADNDVAETYFY